MLTLAAEAMKSLQASLFGSIKAGAVAAAEVAAPAEGIYLMVLSAEAEEEEEIASKLGWKSLHSFILGLKRFCVKGLCS